MDKDFNKPCVNNKTQSQFAIDQEQDVFRNQMQDWKGKADAVIKNKLKTVNKLIKHIEDITTFNEIKGEKNRRFSSLYRKSIDHIQIQMTKNSDKFSIEQLLEQYQRKIVNQGKVISIMNDFKNDIS